jgi:Glycosyl hydrolase family 26
MKRLMAVAVVLLALAPGAGARPEVAKVLLGISGDPVRFQAQTGQKSAIKHVFLGWQQGMTWGTKLDRFLPQLAPIPMIHLGIGGPGATRRARISMQQIANGQGDAYLVYVNKAINAFGSLVYVRPMAEMNNPNALYHPSKGAGMSTEAYRKAFARIFLILHGGPRVKIDVALKRLGLPFLTVKEDLPANPKAKLTVIWNPLAGVGGWMPSYPGDKYVDIVGNDMYGEGVDFSRSANEQLYAFARSHGKRYSLPEWGVRVDQPEFVKYLCDFIKAKPAIVLAAYFNALAGSPWDLAPKPQSKKLYRSCLTPLELMP